LESLAAAHDIADPFLRLTGNAHRRQLARAIEPRQFGGVVPVVFPLHTGALRDERRGDDVAGIAPLAHRAVDHIAGAAGFIARANLALDRRPVEPAFDLDEIV